MKRILTGITPLALAAAALAPAPPAGAEVVGGGPVTLRPGTQICAGAAATSDARVLGHADNPGVVYIVTRNDAEIFRTTSRRTGSFATVTFVGAGSYRACAKNATGLNLPVTGVSLTVLTDGDA